MIRSELVAALRARRDNDVVIVVPLESGGPGARLRPLSVGYDEVTDRITITTELLFDLPEDGAR